MKPKQNATDIINWEAMNTRTDAEDNEIKKRMEEAWKKDYKKRH